MILYHCCYFWIIIHFSCIFPSFLNYVYLENKSKWLLFSFSIVLHSSHRSFDYFMSILNVCFIIMVLAYICFSFLLLFSSIFFFCIWYIYQITLFRFVQFNCFQFVFKRVKWKEKTNCKRRQICPWNYTRNTLAEKMCVPDFSN